MLGTVRKSLPLVGALALVSCVSPDTPAAQEAATPDLIPLPEARHEGPVSLEETLATRRSLRRHGPDAIGLDELAQLLWAAQGITHPMAQAPEGFRWEWRGGLRTAPSAGALYPLELYAVVGSAEGLEPGVYRYVPAEHALRLVSSGDHRAALTAAALGQRYVAAAPVSLVFAGVVSRTAAKYGERAERYVHMEVGAAAENALLQCVALGLAATYVGAFADADVKRALELPAGEEAFAILPIGRPDTE